jgi:carbon-monoxide dehydrogenase medium subunit
MYILNKFEYFEPNTVKDVVEILSRYGAGAKVIAGGVDLIPKMRQQEICPKWLISIQRIPELDYIKNTKKVRIGALTKIRSLEMNPMLQKEYSPLSEAAHQIASIQVKTMSTAVGNICVGTPASDIVAALYALRASLKVVGSSGEKVIPIENFFLGIKKTILEPDELVIEIILPHFTKRGVGAFLKLARSAHDIAKVNVAVMLLFSDEICEDATIALGSVAPTVIRARKAEKIIKNSVLNSDLIAKAAKAAAKEATPISDIRSTAKYRQEVLSVCVRRALQRAASSMANLKGDIR